MTAPLGFRAAGVRSPLASEVRRPGRRGRRQRRAVARRRRRVHHQPGARPRRCCGPEQVVRGGRVRAVVLNSGGANACTGPLGFTGHPRHRRAAGRRARRLGAARSRSARPASSASGCPWTCCCPGWTRPSPTPTAAAVRPPPTRSGPPTPSSRSPSSGQDGYTVGGMAKGAAMLAPALATMLVRAHHRRRPDRRAARRRIARGDQR